MNTKGQGLTLQTIIIAILVLVVLIVVIVIFAKQAGDFNKNLKDCNVMGKPFSDEPDYKLDNCISDGGIPRPMKLHEKEDKSNLNYCCILPEIKNEK